MALGQRLVNVFKYICMIQVRFFYTINKCTIVKMAMADASEEDE
jgi:hypothetical protein